MMNASSSVGRLPRVAVSGTSVVPRVFAHCCFLHVTSEADRQTSLLGWRSVSALFPSYGIHLQHHFPLHRIDNYVMIALQNQFLFASLRNTFLGSRSAGRL
ncbi:hypothetical protein LX36DRAFT_350839 [Colletotrichum falcatum]|nr:hypothetical protein LX36DRAFT_350839 [Colletotrichum falcatum]